MKYIELNNKIFRFYHYMNLLLIYDKYIYIIINFNMEINGN